MKRFVVLAGTCLFALACNNGGSGAGLTRLTEVTSDSKCPSGGVKIATGTDKNGNGKLDDSEVTQTSELCNGATGAAGMDGMNGTNGASGDAGFSALVSTTLLAAGDAHCPDGGTQVDFGLDDGSGGGTAGDGVLQAGEVLSTRYVCNGQLPYFPTTTTAPASPAGQFVIHALGGAGNMSGNGGEGGNVQLRLVPGSLGGGVKVFATGEVDASFTVPAEVSSAPGAAPMTVSADLTLNVYADAMTGLASNDPYFRISGDNRLWANLSGAATEVTSLSVMSGATLTFAVPANASLVDVRVRGDVRNAGTLTTGRLSDGVSAGALNLTASHFYGETGSKVLLSGADAAGGTAGSGGSLTIVSGGLLINQGTIDTSGGAGLTGGSSGSVYLYSTFGAIYNTGAIIAHGGDGTGSGGPALDVAFWAFTRCANSGTIDAHGGGNGNGAAGGNVNLNTYLGATHSKGAVDVRGGSCTVADCSGGSGGYFSINTNSGDAFHDADVDASGGDGYYGGHGGGISFGSSEGAPFSEGGALPAGGLHVSGNLLANGGVGYPAGGAGSVDFAVRPYTLPQGQDLELLGYTEIDVSGGAGDNSSGGSAGVINMYTDLSRPPYAESAGGAASGPVVNQAALKARGGDGTSGGGGGDVELTTQLSFNFGRSEERVSQSGDVDVSGGASSVGIGGPGGYLRLEGILGVDARGTFTARGGTESGGPSPGGGGGSINLIGDDGPVTSSATVDVSGGTSSGTGGDGGGVELNGVGVTNSGNITANGANGTQIGGNGGIVHLTSAPSPTSNTGTLSASAGNGATAGAKGYLYVDGVDVTP